MRGSWFCSAKMNSWGPLEGSDLTLDIAAHSSYPFTKQDTGSEQDNMLVL